MLKDTRDVEINTEILRSAIEKLYKEKRKVSSGACISAYDDHLGFL